jgi:large subunit ribosomal protein L35
MPKMKTHKGAQKRMRVTKNGKVLFHRAGKRHLLSGKSAKRRRRLRKSTTVNDAFLRKIRLLLGG